MSSSVLCTNTREKAPIPISADTTQRMRPGSVIIDLASSRVEIAEATKDKETIQLNGVTIVGNSHLANDVAVDANYLLSNNYLNLIKLLVNKEGKPYAWCQ